MTDIPSRLTAALADRYRIVRELGEGGMASVYLAEDLKHERKVALKILKPELAAVIGAERFLAEIKTTANLQHPHILPLFDSGEADGFLYYVMPFIDGETLAQKLAREGQLGVEEAVRIARDVADALDYAHRAGVIHRDIKPANILLHDGRPVVSDFGIAVAISAAGGGRMTETGLSLGTPHYMSPEQASAERDLTPRSDVYSLGCVLYEMLAGQPPHTGPTAQKILVRILTEDPRPVTDLRRTVPPHVAAVVMKAIEKLPADRFDSARQLIDALGDAGFTHAATSRGATATASTGATGGTEGRRPTSRGLPAWLPWTVAAVFAGIAAYGWMSRPDPELGVPTRWELTGFDGQIGLMGGVSVAVSPQGDAFVVGGLASDEGEPALFVRRADDLEFREIPGTENAGYAAFSPDGAWIVFQQRGALRKVLLAGGPTLPVADSAAGWPSWDEPDWIHFRGWDGIYRVSSAGGSAELVVPDSAYGNAYGPHVLPGGAGLLFGTRGQNVRKVMLLDFGTGQARELADGNNPIYVPTGHIVFGSQDVGFAVPFDLDALEVRGTPVPVLPSLTVRIGGATEFAVSANGTAIYATAPAVAGATGDAGRSPFMWVDLDGTETDIPLDGGRPVYPRISPDGRRIAYLSEGNIWIYDVITGRNRQLSEGGLAEDPAWSPDGTYVYYTFNPENDGADTDDDVYRRRADFSAEAEEVYAGPLEDDVASVTPDGRWVVVRGDSQERDDDLFLVPTQPGGEPRDYLRADWAEWQGEVSPDGRWMAYTSNELGHPEVFVRSFPDPGRPWRISNARATDPVWGPDGTALYYVSNGSMMRASLTLTDTVAVGATTILFPWSAASGMSHREYDIHPDGDRFLAQRGGILGFQGVGRVHVVTDWFTEVRRRMGEAR